MGSNISKFVGKIINRNDPVKILIVGPDAAGKTTMLYNMKLGEIVTTMPTIGFTMEEMEYKNVSFLAFDVGYNHRILKLLAKYYFSGADGLIYIIDSADRDRTDLAQTEFSNMIEIMEEQNIKDSPVLILANKQDLPNALDPGEIVNELSLHEKKDINWYCQGACTITGDGVNQGLEWLSNNMLNKSII